MMLSGYQKGEKKELWLKKHHHWLIGEEPWQDMSSSLQLFQTQDPDGHDGSPAPHEYPTSADFFQVVPTNRHISLNGFAPFLF